MNKKMGNKSKKNKKSPESNDSIDSSDSEGSQAMEVDVEESDDENNNNAQDSDDDDMNFDIGISPENINSKNLEKIIENDAIVSFNSSCVRKKSNWSKASNKYKFDTPQFSPEILLNDIPNNSPKLNILLKKIEQLDKLDMKKHGKLFKHFIFSDLKSSTYGAKLLASVPNLVSQDLRYFWTYSNRRYFLDATCRQRCNRFNRSNRSNWRDRFNRYDRRNRSDRRHRRYRCDWRHRNTRSFLNCRRHASDWSSTRRCLV